MTNSNDFKQKFKAGNFVDALKVALTEAIELKVTTWVVPTDAPSFSDAADGEVLEPLPGHRMVTRINMIDGDIDNEVGSLFLEGGPYEELREFHLSQVGKGREIIAKNLQALQSLFGVLIQGLHGEFTPAEAAIAPTASPSFSVSGSVSPVVAMPVAPSVGVRQEPLQMMESATRPTMATPTSPVMATPLEEFSGNAPAAFDDVEMFISEVDSPGLGGDFDPTTPDFTDAIAPSTIDARSVPQGWPVTSADWSSAPSSDDSPIAEVPDLEQPYDSLSGLDAFEPTSPALGDLSDQPIVSEVLLPDTAMLPESTAEASVAFPGDFSEATGIALPEDFAADLTGEMSATISTPNLSASVDIDFNLGWEPEPEAAGVESAGVVGETGFVPSDLGWLPDESAEDLSLLESSLESLPESPESGSEQPIDVAPALPESTNPISDEMDNLLGELEEVLVEPPIAADVLAQPETNLLSLNDEGRSSDLAMEASVSEPVDVTRSSEVPIAPSPVDLGLNFEADLNLSGQDPATPASEPINLGFDLDWPDETASTLEIQQSMDENVALGREEPEVAFGIPGVVEAAEALSLENSTFDLDRDRSTSPATTSSIGSDLFDDLFSTTDEPVQATIATEADPGSPLAEFTTAADSSSLTNFDLDALFDEPDAATTAPSEPIPSPEPSVSLTLDLDDDITQDLANTLAGLSTPDAAPPLATDAQLDATAVSLFSRGEPAASPVNPLQRDSLERDPSKFDAPALEALQSSSPDLSLPNTIVGEASEDDINSVDSLFGDELPLDDGNLFSSVSETTSGPMIGGEGDNPFDDDELNDLFNLGGNPPQ